MRSTPPARRSVRQYLVPADDPLFRGLPKQSLPQPTVGPTMEAWKARIPQDLEELNAPKRYTLPLEMSRDELVNMASDLAMPMAGSTARNASKAAKLVADEMGPSGVVKMAADRMAKLSDAQFRKLKNSMPSSFEHYANYDELRKARDFLFEESNRRSKVREELRMADKLDPNTLNDVPMSYSDYARAYGPKAAQKRRR